MRMCNPLPLPINTHTRARRITPHTRIPFHILLIKKKPSKTKSIILDRGLEHEGNIQCPDAGHFGEAHHITRTVRELPGDQLERLVEQDDGEGDLEHGAPLLQVQRRDLEHRLESEVGK